MNEQHDQRQNSDPLVSFVVPAYNEEIALAATVDSVLETLNALQVTHFVVIVNDGSHDGTATIADRLAAKNAQVEVIHQDNKGIGGAFKAGLQRSRGRYVMLWPSDMPCSVEVLKPLLDATGKADVIVGCRRSRAGYSWLMRFNSWLYPMLLRILFGMKLYLRIL